MGAFLGGGDGQQSGLGRHSLVGRSGALSQASSPLRPTHRPAGLAPSSSPLRPLSCPAHPVIRFPVLFPGPRTCKELLTRGHFLSGWHTIYLPDCRPLTVLCDMDTDGGGWTVSVEGSGTAVWSSGGGGRPGNPTDQVLAGGRTRALWPLSNAHPPLSRAGPPISLRMGATRNVGGGEPMWERIQAVEEAWRELTAFQLCGSGLVAYPL